MAMPDGRGRDIAPSRDLSPADREEDGARPRRLVDALAAQNFLFTGAPKGRAFRRIWPLLSIVLPTVLAAVYFLLIAAGQYASEFRAVIKPADPSALESGSAVASGSTMSGIILLQSNIVVQYIKSSDIVSTLDRRLGLRARYSTDQADIFARANPDISQERLVDYWNGKVSPFFDTTTGTLSVRVKAFTPQDAQQIAEGVIAASENLVNNMAQRGRDDAVRSANNEVRLSLDRLRKARQALLDYQSRQHAVSPKEEVQNNLAMLAKLEEQRGEAQATLDFYRGADNAPSALVLRNRIAALNGQIGALNTRLTAARQAGQTASLSERLGNFDALDSEREMAEKAYDTAVTALDRAKYDAGRQATYLEVFVRPNLPQDATYPKRWEAIFLTFLAGCGLWLLGIVVYQSVRDHV